eukprot:5074805-Alexandrium_andersonii.AAC.1
MNEVGRGLPAIDALGGTTYGPARALRGGGGTSMGALGGSGGKACTAVGGAVAAAVAADAVGAS